MGGSSGAGGTSTATQLPPWVAGPHKNLISKAENFVYGDRGSYIPYTNDRIAGFTPEEQQAFQARQDLFNRGDPMGTYGQNQLNSVSGIPTDLVNHSMTTFDQNNMNQYMNPYVRGVLDPQLRQARESFDQQLNQSEADSVARGGAVGSYRQGLERSLLEGRKAQTLSDIEGAGMSRAYEMGLGAFQQDRSARMTGAAQAGEMGMGLAGMANTVGEGNLARMNEVALGLERAGATKKEMAQKELDMAYNDFTTERDWPMRNMSYLSTILSGVPNQNLGISTTTQAQPGLLSQLSSLGLGAAALQQLFAGQQ